MSALLTEQVYVNARQAEEAQWRNRLQESQTALAVYRVYVSMLLAYLPRGFHPQMTVEGEPIDAPELRLRKSQMWLCGLTRFDKELVHSIKEQEFLADGLRALGA